MTSKIRTIIIDDNTIVVNNLTDHFNKSDKIETINGKIIAVIYILFIGYLAFIGI